MEKKYVCKTCGFSIREIELEDWPKHDFINKLKMLPDEIPEYSREKDCDAYEIQELYVSNSTG